MPTLTLKDVPEGLHRKLKERAAQNRRSINSEVIHCLEGILAEVPTDPDAYLALVRPLREKTARLPLNDKRLKAARHKERS